MKQLSRSLMLLAVVVGTACSSEPTNPLLSFERWVLLELDGRALPTRIGQSSAASDSVYSDTLYLNLRLARAVQVAVVRADGLRVRLEQNHEIAHRTELLGIGIDFHCSVPGPCPGIYAPTFGNVVNDTLVFPKTAWNEERRYVRR